MAAVSSMKIQEIWTSMSTRYPRSAGAPSQRSPHRTPFQQYHSFHTSIETLLLSTMTTLSCLAHPRTKMLKDCMTNLRGGETHRLRKRRRRKFGSSRLSWPKHGLTPQQLLHWRRSVSRPDLAGASIAFVRVGILCCATNVRRGEYYQLFYSSRRCGRSRRDPATWCIACQSQQGGAQGDSSRVCE